MRTYMICFVSGHAFYSSEGFGGGDVAQREIANRQKQPVMQTMHLAVVEMTMKRLLMRRRLLLLMMSEITRHAPMAVCSSK